MLGSTFFRNSLGLWKAAMQDCGLWNDLEEQANYLLAAGYPRCAKQKPGRKSFATRSSTRPVNYTADGAPKIVASASIMSWLHVTGPCSSKSSIGSLIDPTYQPYCCQHSRKPSAMGRQRRLHDEPERAGSAWHQFLSELKIWLDRFRKRGGNDQYGRSSTCSHTRRR